VKKIAFVLLAATIVACGGGSRTLIQNKGSDTLLEVAQAWAEAYRDVNPEVSIAVSGGGSGTGISALINGTVDIANASREITDEEMEAARANGANPEEFVIGFDALAVFVHADNPASEFSVAQLAEIYGEGGATDRWSQLGITVPGCASDEIVRASRQNSSGTYVYFRNTILGEARDFKLGSRDMAGSKDVVDLVANTPCAIGYSGLAYATDEVKMPCITAEENGTCVAPSVDAAVDGSYPIARSLLMYTRDAPAGAVAEYLDWILSDEGQCIIKEVGYAPVRLLSCS
jgi:phosphate transport system substrate-binding protein